MDNKGQGALEYLLLIGGAVLIAAIVIAVLANMSTSANTKLATTQTQYNTTLNQINSKVPAVP